MPEPPLRAAWEAIKKLNNATKYYFRGQSPPAIVDVDKHSFADAKAEIEKGLAAVEELYTASPKLQRRWPALAWA